MINYHYETWEVDEIWFVDVYGNSDCLANMNNLASQREAEQVGQAFINGIKFVRGELDE